MFSFTGERYIPGVTNKRISDDHLERYRFASRFVENANVLDLACGVGYGCAILREAGAKSVDGVDISNEAIEFARKEYKVEGLSFFVSDASTYIPDRKYDVIVSFETIEHIEDYYSLIEMFFKNLNPGGVLLISSPNRVITSPDRGINVRPLNKFHVREFTPEELVIELKKVGFVLEGDCLFGQRQQKYFINKYFRKIYRKLFNPDSNTSPEVTSIEKTPKYFILVAKRK